MIIYAGLHWVKTLAGSFKINKTSLSGKTIIISVIIQINSTTFLYENIDLTITKVSLVGKWCSHVR